MFKILILLLVFLASTALSTAAAGKRPPDDWNFYHFDGTVFKTGPAADGSAFIALREKVYPLVLISRKIQLEQRELPDGAGVIAGICYLQSAGGKLKPGSGFKVCRDTPLRISLGGKPFLTVQTDNHGYFVAVLPAGTYTIGSGPFTTEVTAERGITTLVPLRAGKRMVD